MNTIARWRAKVRKWVESDKVQRLIIALIIINSISIGLETSEVIMHDFGYYIYLFDDVILFIFIAEILLKLFAYQWRFFRSSWNLFDFVIIGVAAMPESGLFSILRTLRIIRVLRLFKQLEKLRMIVEAFLRAIASIGWISVLLGIIFYVFAVICTNVFGSAFPEWFGDLGASTYTLFQIMTLESWSMGIARPVMDEFPYAWLIFIPFILVATYITVNIFIAVVVSAMNEIQLGETEAHHDEDVRMLRKDNEELKAEIQEIKTLLKQQIRNQEG